MTVLDPLAGLVNVTVLSAAFMLSRVPWNAKLDVPDAPAVTVVEPCVNARVPVVVARLTAIVSDVPHMPVLRNVLPRPRFRAAVAVAVSDWEKSTLVTTRVETGSTSSAAYWRPVHPGPQSFH